MKAIRKLPGKPFEAVEIENTLKALQKEVGGHIETVTPFEDVSIICNEEGRLIGLGHNFTFCGTTFVGPVLIVGVDEDSFTDLNQEAIEFFLALKWEKLQ